MRFFVIAFMIALLPVRGWLGDAMAADMLRATLAQNEIATENIADSAYSSRAGSHFSSENSTSQMPAGHADCAGHEPADNADDTGMDAHCSTCTVCQTCHTVALSPVMASLSAAPHPHALPASLQPRYASAERALFIKPPIS